MSSVQSHWSSSQLWYDENLHLCIWFENISQKPATGSECSSSGQRLLRLDANRLSSFYSRIEAIWNESYPDYPQLKHFMMKLNKQLIISSTHLQLLTNSLTRWFCATVISFFPFILFCSISASICTDTMEWRGRLTSVSPDLENCVWKLVHQCIFNLLDRYIVK